MVPWILSSTVKDEYMEARKPKVRKYFGDLNTELVEEMHNSLSWVV